MVVSYAMTMIVQLIIRYGYAASACQRQTLQTRVIVAACVFIYHYNVLSDALDKLSSLEPAICGPGALNHSTS